MIRFEPRPSARPLLIAIAALITIYCFGIFVLLALPK